VLVSVQAATYGHLAVGITGQTIGAQRDISRDTPSERSDGPVDRVVDDGDEGGAGLLGVLPGIHDHLLEPAHLLCVLVGLPDADMDHGTIGRGARVVADQAVQRRNSMAVAGTLLAEEHRHPELLAAFRHRLVEPRRAALRQALAEGISSGELPDSADPDVLASMLIGSFYARYIATSDIPDDWAERTLRQVWPDAPQRTAMCQVRPR